MAEIENEEVEEEEEEKQVTEIPLVPQSLIKSNPPILNNSHNHNYILPCETSSTSMVNIFPPINHENLRPEPPDQSLPDQEMEASPLPGSEIAVNRASAAAETWWDLGFNYLRCKVNHIVSRLCNYNSGGGFRFWSSVAAAAMLVGLWYLRFQKQRRRRMIMRKESRDQLIRVIKEKDERINTLLRQVSQMNEILLGIYTIKKRPST